MSKLDDYRQTLKKRNDWIPFLLRESGLPGPRGNLELGYAGAEEGSRRQFKHFLSFQAQENTLEVFLVFCGVIGLGKLAAKDSALFKQLRQYASDLRWRVREAVATGLQLTGDEDMDLLINEMLEWSSGNWYEKRAAAAALAEPRLLKQPKSAEKVLQVLDEITESMESAKDSKDAAFRVLRKAMGYCWSVGVAAVPEAGKPSMEKWLDHQDQNIHWVIKENLKKNRLIKMDADWVRVCTEKVEQAS